MAVLYDGQVAVTSGSDIARYVWEGVGAPFSGNPGPGACTWDGGAGVLTFFSGAPDYVARLYRTSGNPPSLGSAITVTSSGAIFGMVSWTSSPPDFQNRFSGSSEYRIFSIPSLLEAYSMRLIPGVEDAVSLTPSYLGVDTDEIGFEISSGYTPFLGLPLISYGDADALSLMSRAFREVDVASSGARSRPNFHASYETLPGVSGGDAVSGGVWRPYIFQSGEKKNSIVGSSFFSNAVLTLPAGTYLLDANAVGHMCRDFRIRLVDVSSGITVATSPNMFTDEGLVFSDPTRTVLTGFILRVASVLAEVRAQVTIAETRSFLVQYRCSLTRNGDGLGFGRSWGENNVFGNLYAWRIN